MSEKDEIYEQNYMDLLMRESQEKFEKQKLKPNPNGLCLWCEEPVETVGSIFCSLECGEDKERYDKANLRLA